jgi:hypothetical protein
MSFKKLAKREELSSSVRAYSVKSATKVVILSGQIDGFDLHVGQTYSAYVGEGEDMGWVMIDPQGSDRKASRINTNKNGNKLTAGVLLPGLKPLPSKTVQCEHYVKDGCLYVNVPFLPQAKEAGQ